MNKARQELHDKYKWEIEKLLLNKTDWTHDIVDETTTKIVGHTLRLCVVYLSMGAFIGFLFGWLAL